MLPSKPASFFSTSESPQELDLLAARRRSAEDSRALRSARQSRRLRREPTPISPPGSPPTSSALTSTPHAHSTADRRSPNGSLRPASASTSARRSVQSIPLGRLSPGSAIWSPSFARTASSSPTSTPVVVSVLNTPTRPSTRPKPLRPMPGRSSPRPKASASTSSSNPDASWSRRPARSSALSSTSRKMAKKNVCHHRRGDERPHPAGTLPGPPRNSCPSSNPPLPSSRSTSSAPSASPEISSPGTENLAPVKPGDLLAILDAGAYGMTQASNYNSRPRPAEILVTGNASRLIRRRETHRDLFAQELL